MKECCRAVYLRVHLYGGFGGAKMRPRKNLEREINGRRVERVHGVFQINSKRVTRIKAPRLDDQGVGKITVNLPVAFLVGIGQIAARDVTANAEMVKFGLVRAQANFDVTQALAEGQLREGNCAKAMHRY